jgi:dienelactone hydrolase
MTSVIDPGIRSFPVRDDGLIAMLFLPSSPPPYPVVVTLGGSGGGLFTQAAELLSSRGIAALSLAYFGVAGLPAELKCIPLEYIGTAIRWLGRRADLRPGAVGIAGASRGGELALLVAATYPEIRAVVGWAPSGLIYGGVSRNPEIGVSAWSYRGHDLPFAGFDASAVEWDRTPIRFTPGFVAALSDTAAVEAAEIPVERINGPVLLVSGTDDQVWPSSVLSEMAMCRLRERGHQFPFEHLSYEGAGHAIAPPHPRFSFGTTHFVHPVTGYDFELGGTPETNARASANSWQRVVTFFIQRFASL